MLGSVIHPFAGGDNQLYVTLIDLGETTESTTTDNSDTGTGNDNIDGSGISSSSSSGTGTDNSDSAAGNNGSSSSVNNNNDNVSISSEQESDHKKHKHCFGGLGELGALFGLTITPNDASTSIAVVNGREYRMAVTAHPLYYTSIYRDGQPHSIDSHQPPWGETTSYVGQNVVCLTNVKPRTIKNVHSSAVILFSKGASGSYRSRPSSSHHYRYAFYCFYCASD